MLSYLTVCCACGAATIGCIVVCTVIHADISIAAGCCQTGNLQGGPGEESRSTLALLKARCVTPLRFKLLCSIYALNMMHIRSTCTGNGFTCAVLPVVTAVLAYMPKRFSPIHVLWVNAQNAQPSAYSTQDSFNIRCNTVRSGHVMSHFMYSQLLIACRSCKRRLMRKRRRTSAWSTQRSGLVSWKMRTSS